MNVLLLGATGTAGSAITKKLLETTDYKVTLFARRAKEAGVSHPNAVMINGDATKEEDIRAVLQGQDVVYCAVSGEQLTDVAKNLVTIMDELGMKRLIFMGAVGIYNELLEGLGAQYNVDSEESQVPNLAAVEIIEKSGLNYTVLRPGFLRDGAAEDYVLTLKGEAPRGYITTIPSVVELAVRLIQDEKLYVRENVGITRDMTR